MQSPLDALPGGWRTQAQFFRGLPRSGHSSATRATLFNSLRFYKEEFSMQALKLRWQHIDARYFQIIALSTLLTLNFVWIDFGAKPLYSALAIASALRGCEGSHHDRRRAGRISGRLRAGASVQHDPGGGAALRSRRSAGAGPHSGRLSARHFGGSTHCTLAVLSAIRRCPW